jgi:7-carboxy-7-deazaguanine synthase
VNTQTQDQPGDQRLRITEIFYSLQGEARTAGIPTVFIRLTGCPLRCGYCDTSYAFQGGKWMSFDEIESQVRKYDTRFVTVTGGEPLAQKPCPELLLRLVEAGYEVSLETSGALDINRVDSRVSRVVDIKTPDSGESDKNLLDNLDHLTPNDQVKFVICSRADYEWSVDFIRRHRLTNICDVLFSPAYNQLGLQQLAEWVLQDQLSVRVQTQLHKLIWGEQPGR